MYIPKRYGQSKTDKCPFCSKQATTENKQGVPVCQNDKDEQLGEMKCLCGEMLTMMTGKYGIFFNCINCGNKNLSKVLEFNTLKKVETKESKTFDELKSSGIHQTKEKSKEIFIKSDDPLYFD